MSYWRTGVLLAVTTLAAHGVAHAQVFTPTYLAPRSSGDVGVYLSDGPGDFAVEGIWRRPMGAFDLGFRAGIADAEDALVMIGAEYRNPIATGAPIDLAATGGVQAILGDLDAVGLQAGLSIGYTFTSPGVSFTPYLHPRLALVNGFGGDDDFELEGLADIGVDLDFSPNLSIRIGVGIGDDQADVGVGIAWR